MHSHIGLHISLPRDFFLHPYKCIDALSDLIAPCSVVRVPRGRDCMGRFACDETECAILEQSVEALASPCHATHVSFF